MLITKPCAVCGQPARVQKPCRWERTKYCSRVCANIGRRGHRSSPVTEFKKGSTPPGYNGGRWIDNGYLNLKRKEHPRANSNGYVPEHILNWEASRGFALPRGWLVHHVNYKKQDNRPTNLFAVPRKFHGALHARNGSRRWLCLRQIWLATTAQVAESLGRLWVGIELNRDYEPLIKKRTEQIGMVL